MKFWKYSIDDEIGFTWAFRESVQIKAMKLHSFGSNKSINFSFSLFLKNNIRNFEFLSLIINKLPTLNLSYFFFNICPNFIAFYHQGKYNTNSIFCNQILILKKGQHAISGMHTYGWKPGGLVIKINSWNLATFNEKFEIPAIVIS